MHHIEAYTTEDYYRTSDQGIDPETTVAYVFRHIPGEINPYFRGGLSYGKTLAREFIERGLLFSGAHVLEVGGGEGQLADEMLNYAKVKKIYPDRYTMLDLNPYFLRAQRTRIARPHSRVAQGFIQANAASLPIADGSIDFVVSNEVIADFPVIKNIDPLDILSYQAIPHHRFSEHQWQSLTEAHGLINRYDLEIRANGKLFHLNSGAIYFLEQIHRILKPGGAAFLSEHSCEIERTDYWDDVPGFFAPETGKWFPEELELSGHSEFSIKFSHLKQVAEKLGFTVESEHLYKLIGLKNNRQLMQLGVDDPDQDNLDGLGKYFSALQILQFRYLLIRKKHL